MQFFISRDSFFKSRFSSKYIFMVLFHCCFNISCKFKIWIWSFDDFIL